MTSQERVPAVPAAVERKLAAVRRIELLQRALAGLMWTAVVLVAAMLAAMVLDWAVTFFDTAWRYSLTVAALAAAALAACWALVAVVRSWRRLSSVAREVDQAVPQLQERWSTITELAESDDAPAVRGSPVLINQVAREAGEMSALVAPRQVVPARTVARSARALALAAAVLALFLLVGGQTALILLQRFWAPGQPITQTRVTSLTGDRVVPRGEPLTIEAELGGRTRDSASILFRGQAMSAEPVEMSRADKGPANFAWATKAAAQSFEYRVRSGDGQTPWHRIEVADRPALAAVRFRVTPPEYSRLPAQQSDNLPSRARALEGSRLELDLLATKLLQKMELKVGKDASVPIARGEGQWYRLARPLNESLSFAIHLTDQQGLANAKPPACQITVFPDQPPEVEIVSPEQEIVVRPDDVVAIEANARDDLGVSRMELVVTSGQGDEEKELKVLPMPLQKPGAREVKSQVELDLKPFNLKQGAELKYLVRATDSREAVGSASRTMGTAGKGQESQRTASTQSPHEQKDSQQGQDSSQQKDSQQGEDSKQAAPGTEQVSESSRRTGGKSRPGDRSQQEPQQGAPRPPDNTERRTLPGAGAACSGQQRIRIDEWADTHESQKRKKLELAIDQFLARLDAALAAAEKPTYQLADHVRAARPWREAEAAKLAGARGQLDQGDKVISELANLSAGTPYSFIGQQLQDIGMSHVTPARAALAEAGQLSAKPPEQFRQLEQGAYHITRARARLADLTKTYEAVKREKDLADRLAEVKKMHQMFVEDLQAMLTSSKPTLNPRTGKMTELSDEEIEALKEKLQEHFERLKELLAKLSEALAKDPELLRRFMAAMRLDGTTVRDQLTLLALRQQALCRDVTEWTQAGPDRVGLVKARIAAAQQREQAELGEAAAQLYDNMVTWSPRGVDATQGPLKECRELSAEIARSAARLASEAAGDRQQSGARAFDLAKQLTALDDKLSAAAALDEGNEKLSQFAANRKVEAAKLAAREAAWAVKVKALDDGKYGLCGEVDQSRLLMDTGEFCLKLERYQAMLSRISTEIRQKATELCDTVSGEIIGHQQAAHASLAKEELKSAREAESRAVQAFEKAEKLFDELLTLIENSQPPAGGGVPPLPSLEDLLAMLENEATAAEKLGLACNMINLTINADWMMPGSKTGMGSGSGSGQGSGRNGQVASAYAQAKAAKSSLDKGMRQMDKARQDALREAGKLAKPPPPEQPAPLDPAGKRQPGDDKDWATLVSKLAKELRQVRDNVPPEQYQRLISEYFRTISEAVDQAQPAE